MFDTLAMAKELLETAYAPSVIVSRSYGITENEPMQVTIDFIAPKNDGVILTLGIECENKKHYIPSRILKSGNRTIVFWTDGTKTIVKRAEDEPDNDYAAFTAALGIKIFGSNSALRRMIKKSVKVQEKKKPLTF